MLSITHHTRKRPSTGPRTAHGSHLLAICKVHTCMCFLEFIIYAGNQRWRGDFRDKFIKHFMRRSWSPSQVKTRDEHDSKWTKDRSINK
jgi:hypothetical protein